MGAAVLAGQMGCLLIIVRRLAGLGARGLWPSDGPFVNGGFRPKEAIIRSVCKAGANSYQYPFDINKPANFSFGRYEYLDELQSEHDSKGCRALNKLSYISGYLVRLPIHS
jgi:hypothetical protein